MADVAPAAIAAKASTADPTVVLNSLSLAPAVSACKAGSLAPAVVVTNPTVVAMFLLNRPISLSLAERNAIHLANVYELEDGSGRWLFEDGAAILLGEGEGGNSLSLGPRSLALTLGEEHG